MVPGKRKGCGAPPTGLKKVASGRRLPCTNWKVSESEPAVSPMLDLLRVGDTAAMHELEGFGKRARSVPDASRPCECRGHAAQIIQCQNLQFLALSIAESDSRPIWTQCYAVDLSRARSLSALANRLNSPRQIHSWP